MMLHTIEIFQETNNRKQTGYRAVRGKQQAKGKTPGQPLDSLEKLLTTEENAANSLIILQRFQPDAFFTKDQQESLQLLLGQFRQALDTGEELSQEERAKLEQLVDAEWIGAIARATTILARPDLASE
jgi:hypothetical protein